MATFEEKIEELKQKFEDTTSERLLAIYSRLFKDISSNGVVLPKDISESDEYRQEILRRMKAGNNGF